MLLSNLIKKKILYHKAVNGTLLFSYNLEFVSSNTGPTRSFFLTFDKKDRGRFSWFWKDEFNLVISSIALIAKSLQ